MNIYLYILKFLCIRGEREREKEMERGTGFLSSES